MTLKLYFFLFLLQPMAEGSYRDLSQLTLKADAPICFDYQCNVKINFEGFSDVDGDLFEESEDFYPCGGFGSKTVVGDPFIEPYDTSRTMLVMTDKLGMMEKNCNRQRMPTTRVSSLHPFRMVYFKPGKVPKKIFVKFKDRLTGNVFPYKVTVPPELPPADYKCDHTSIPAFRDSIGFKNYRMDMGRLYNFCFNSRSLMQFFSVRVINRGNASCSDLELRLIEPNGNIKTSNGPEPGVWADTMPGMYRAQFFLNYGCDFYDVVFDF